MRYYLPLVTENMLLDCELIQQHVSVLIFVKTECIMDDFMPTTRIHMLDGNCTQEGTYEE